jgi:pyruvate/2-oxoglutarate/acetoin dehydrogenase E1 component
MGAVLKMKERVTVGSLIDAMHSVREARRSLSEQDKKLSAELINLESQLLNLMDEEGITKSTGKTASASISESTQFNVTDWDSFVAYMSKKKWFHLIQRRISAPAVREIFEKSGAVPGLEPFTKREIGLRNL